ncbi:hypothetical protein J1N35_039635 [Gossypium stocksii]|uniref:Uncharacterized protein n=1 Tax=Gossypium stocksii TaxID=47602 RepID=A0A9D3UC51_9ROSI|nr:hypothetical protein J1N35_039635 [Gossypium stocksii]
MLLTLEGWIAKLEGFVDKMKESLEVVERRTVELDLEKYQLKGQVLDALNGNIEGMRVAFNSTVGRLSEWDDAFELVLTALKEQIEELKEELIVCRATVGKMGFGYNTKPSDGCFKREKSGGDMENFL